MAAVPASGPNPILFEVPDPPREFGQDGGRFYRLYDDIAEEIDEDLTKRLKEQLEGLLLFAGLFAGVNSAFLALTLPLLSADPADDTNALLAQNNAILLQIMQGRNDTSPSDSSLPSASFSPLPGIFTVNTLFSISLTLAIISSFLAVLGRQWLVYYRKRTGSGPDRQRWEQLKRFLGVEQWHLELVLDDILPSLLQIGLVIFWLPNSSIPTDISNAIWSCLGRLELPGNSISVLAKKHFLHVTKLRGSRSEVTFLQIVALKRTICTSDDSLTLLCAAANIFTIDETRYLEALWSDEEFHPRFLELCTSPHQRIVQLLGRDRTEIAVSAARLYRGALAHIVLSVNDPFDREVPSDVSKAITSESLVDSDWLIPLEMVDECSPVLLQAALASWMLRACVGFIPLDRIVTYLTRYSDSLSISSWRLTSLLVYILSLIAKGSPEMTTRSPDPLIIRFGESTREQFSNSSGESVIGDPPTAETIQGANIDSASRHTFMHSPRDSSVIEPMVDGAPRGAVGTPIMRSTLTIQPIQSTQTIMPDSNWIESPRWYSHRSDNLEALNIEELREAYTRDVSNTLSALEEVTVNLARQLYEGDLDCHRILLNILKSAREVINNENRYPNTKIGNKLDLLEITEQVLRIENIGTEVRTTATMLRINVVAILRRHFELIRRDVQQRAIGDSSRLSNEEDKAVLHQFASLLHEIYAYPLSKWRIDRSLADLHRMTTPQDVCDEVRQVYHNFRAKVDRNFRALEVCTLSG
ncbi:hypothetical protein FRC01_003208 [Tulasnella sp. 417]|nr:hypothetical protein FRC01_003208 [Tulasnella sp. 417]